MAAKRPMTQESDSYLTKVITYIPTEIIAAYVAISGLIKSIQPARLQYPFFWGVAGLLLCLTPIWITSARDTENSRHRGHALASALAFAAWVFATGGPFNEFLFDPKTDTGWYHPSQGSIILIIVCLLLPRIGDLMKGTAQLREAIAPTTSATPVTPATPTTPTAT